MPFGNLRIPAKLALLVLVPLLGVVALSVPIVAGRVGLARDAEHTADVVGLATQTGSALQELHEERLLSAGYLSGLVQRPELVVQSARADAALEALRRRPGGIPAELLTVLTGATRLSQTRQAVLARTVSTERLVADFNAVITPAIGAIGLDRVADLSTAAGRQVFALDQALRTDDTVGQVVTLLIGAVVTKDAALAGRFGDALVQLRKVASDVQPYLTPDQSKIYIGAQQGLDSRLGLQFLGRVTADPAAAVRLLDAPSLFPSLRSVSVLGGFVEKRIAADVTVAVGQDRDRALRDAGLIGVGSLLLLLVVVGLCLAMARAVARPLRRLTVSADRIARAAETELERVADDESETVRPIRLDRVDVTAGDEIGDLARAFDRVQSTAARLVERQVAGRRNVAQMFGHVGRRTQNLVGRQLALIDQLERRETDADRLRELYRLDHMSSRLRRNASSLVVLSGGAGTNEHMAPLPLFDVVRLALGEIEDYPRVDVEIADSLVIVPAVIADLTLLLAELLENATAFSPPHTRVTVAATEHDGGLRIAVVDHGLGLSPERMTEENARLHRRERLDLAPSEVLGLFVVGRLARRHQIEVTLTATAGGGVTAITDLQPSHLLPRTIQATIPGQHPAEFAAAAGAVRSARGSAQPFDEQMLDRATKTLKVARVWNAFLPAGAERPALTGHQDLDTVYDAETFEDDDLPAPDPAPDLTPGRATAELAAAPHPVRARPASLEEVEPVRPAARPARPATLEEAGPGVPRQRVPGRPTTLQHLVAAESMPLQQRIPGSRLPSGTGGGPVFPAAPPSADDAAAARAALAQFQDGVGRAKWDAIKAELTTPPSLGNPTPATSGFGAPGGSGAPGGPGAPGGNPPLSRRVPGATMPPPRAAAAPAGPARPLDPDEARALVEQFEDGVALAMRETRPQHEGQAR